MQKLFVRNCFVWLSTAATVTLIAVAAGAMPPNQPTVTHQGQVTRQDVPSKPGSEPDTVVEPDVAVSPLNGKVAIAAAHDSRYANGGAVGISVAWTADGGAHWHHMPVRGITTATGGSYQRASDPVVAFGPDGTAYLSVLLINATSCPTAVAVLRSTTGGQTWSKPFYAHKSATCDYSDDKNWLVVDDSAPDAAPGAQPDSPRPRLQRFATAAAAIDAAGPNYASTSTDGGARWSHTVEITNLGGGFADGVRCCLFGADIDSVTHTMYVAWNGGVADTDPVYVSSSTNGRLWSSPIRVSRGDVSGVQRVNVDVAARAGRVYIGYGTRTRPEQNGGYVQQQLSVSYNGGRSFGPPISVGPRSVLKYAARSDGFFPGDYIGEAVARGRLYMVWAVSSKPPAYSSSKFHQIIYGATFRL